MVWRSWLVGSLWIAVVGCGGHKGDTSGAPQEVAVAVSAPVEASIRGFEEFTGRTEALESVEVRARVTGYINEIPFKPGSNVTKDKDLLFLIDPRPFEADLDKAEGEIAKAQAQLLRADADLERAKTLRPKGTITQEDFDRTVADQAVATAALKYANAASRQAQLNYQYTRVVAPITGRVGRPLITEGNLVVANQTVLTTIVSQGGVYAYFDVDELTWMKYDKDKAKGADAPANGAEKKRKDIEMAFVNEPGFPHHGEIDFYDNQLAKSTGTIQIRAKFDEGSQLPSGAFVRLRVPVGDPKPGLLISDRAVATDQGLSYVWVVDKDQKIVYRPVKLGNWQDNLRVVEDGLQAGEQIVVSGLQSLREGITVKTQVIPMPGSDVTLPVSHQTAPTPSK